MQRFAPRATVAFAAGTTLGAGSEHERLTASQGSGLEQIDGTESARHDHIWVSAAQRFNRVGVRGRIGQARTDARDLTTYEIAADLTPTDGLTLSLGRDAGFFVVSPRTVGLGLSQISHRASLGWAPGIRWQIAADVWRQSLSDGNHRWEFTVSPRHGLARTALVNLDLGATVSQLRTTTNYENGYYDPARYEFYAVTANPYWKAGESTGFGLSLAVGAQRDDFSPELPARRQRHRGSDFRHLRPVGAQGERRQHGQSAARKRRVPRLRRRRDSHQTVLDRSSPSCAFWSPAARDSSGRISRRPSSLRGDEVVVLDDLSTGRLENIAHLTAWPRILVARSVR